MVKKSFFRILARLNRVLMPRYSKRDLSRLTKLDKMLIAYRYWVTLHALE